MSNYSCGALACHCELELEALACHGELELEPCPPPFHHAMAQRSSCVTWPAGAMAWAACCG